MRQFLLLPALLALLAVVAEARVIRAEATTGLGPVVASAQAGDTIRVEPGLFLEDSVLVDRRLTLLGQPGAMLDANGGGHALLVRADSVVIRGLEIRNASQSYRIEYAAIQAENCRGLEVSGCHLVQDFFGVYLANCRDSRITGNRIEAVFESETRSGNGIHLWKSTGILIADNTITGHRDGIYLEFARHARIEGNTGTNNLRYGLHFMFSDSCDYRRNRFAGNGAGVAVMYSRQVDMSGNSFEDNWGPAACGLLLKEISDSRITDNRFRANTCGLHVEASNRLQARGNTFERNGWALRLLANSMDGHYEDNRFEANGFDVATQGRQNHSRFTGNHWDRYRGYDLDRDGFGDVPFRPVSVFSTVVARQAPALVLLRSLFVELLDLAERAFPLLTPPSLQDERPRMRARR